MSHWFDRLAAWSAEEPAGQEELLLTRRQAVRAAATGAGTIGLLGSPLLAQAFGQSAQEACQCAKDSYRRFYDKSNELEDQLIRDPPLPVAVLAAPVYLAAYAGLAAGTYAGQIYHCGATSGDCKKLPSTDPPPPQFQPDFGGYVPAPPSASGCAPGTVDCGGGQLCCFGEDLCCGECCCVKEVGCTCCG